MDQPQSSDTKPLIYIVDDEPLLVDLAEVCLIHEGYRFKKFLNPSTAYDSFKAESTKPAVLLTDYMMSQMNGLELAFKCKQLHPDLKVLLISGTATELILIDAPVKVDGFLAKPYAPAVLVRRVRELLQQTPRDSRDQV